MSLNEIKNNITKLINLNYKYYVKYLWKVNNYRIVGVCFLCPVFMQTDR